MGGADAALAGLGGLRLAASLTRLYALGPCGDLAFVMMAVFSGGTCTEVLRGVLPRLLSGVARCAPPARVAVRRGAAACGLAGAGGGDGVAPVLHPYPPRLNRRAEWAAGVVLGQRRAGVGFVNGARASPGLGGHATRRGLNCSAEPRTTSIATALPMPADEEAAPTPHSDVVLAICLLNGTIHTPFQARKPLADQRNTTHSAIKFLITHHDRCSARGNFIAWHRTQNTAGLIVKHDGHLGKAPARVDRNDITIDHR